MTEVYGKPNFGITVSPSPLPRVFIGYEGEVESHPLHLSVEGVILGPHVEEIISLTPHFKE
jgi:hypothetical protein